MMKARSVSYAEVEHRLLDLLEELGREPHDNEAILEKATEAAFLLEVCLAQLGASSSAFYPGKDKHLARLKRANDEIKFKLNTCTVEEISTQVTAACKAFTKH